MILRLLWTALAVFLQLLVPCQAASKDTQEDEFVGWRGATYNPKSTFGYGISEPFKVSDRPLAYVWKNFISKDEAKHIATLAAPHLKQSLVGDNQKANTVRSSYGTFIPRYQDAVMARISDRVEKWTGLPSVNHEDMQVLRYSPGQNYIKHLDAHGRMATLLIYLTDTTEGGETAFPSTTDANWVDRSLKPEGLSPDCAEGHVAVKPEVGTGLLFYSMAPGAEADESLRVVDELSMHTGCPPAEGQIKWTATVWMHYEPFRPESFSKAFPKRPVPDRADCTNVEPRCDEWARAGECTANPTYMVGSDTAIGHCELACGACTKCEVGDHACRGANRERYGYLGDLEAELAQLFPPTADDDQ